MSNMEAPTLAAHELELRIDAQQHHQQQPSPSSLSPRRSSKQKKKRKPDSPSESSGEYGAMGSGGSEHAVSAGEDEAGPSSSAGPSVASSNAASTSSLSGRASKSGKRVRHAKAGGDAHGPASGSGAASSSSGGHDNQQHWSDYKKREVAAQFQKLKEQYEKGLMTPDEYKQAKNALIDNLTGTITPSKGNPGESLFVTAECENVVCFLSVHSFISPLNLRFAASTRLSHKSVHTWRRMFVCACLVIGRRRTTVLPSRRLCQSLTCVVCVHGVYICSLRMAYECGNIFCVQISTQRICRRCHKGMRLRDQNFFFTILFLTKTPSCQSLDQIV
eukprot:Opistho-2@75460